MRILSEKSERKMKKKRDEFGDLSSDGFDYVPTVKFSKDVEDKVYKFMLDKVGEEFAVKAPQIAKHCGINQTKSDSYVRAILSQMSRNRKLPLVSNAKGYFIPKDELELLAYIENLEKRINAIIFRKSLVYHAFMKYYNR